MRNFLVIVIFSLLAKTLGIAQAHPAIVTARCTACHPAPRPASMPVYAWPRIMNSMSKLMEIAGLEMTQAEYDEIEAYYVANSPDRLAQIPDDYAPDTLKFNRFPIGKISPGDRPMVTSVKVCDLNGDGIENQLVVTDNVFGAVSVLTSHSGAWLETEIAKIPAPVNSTPFDYDGDGDIDLAISAMGYMHPNDELIGEFHLLINQGDGTFEPRKLLENVPRITDCAPGDYDGDGDIDFVLAMFGWRYTGAIGYLEQVEKDRFEFSSILDINGCMKVIQNDANGDEFPDFVALITQQHESIVQFINNGDGTFSNYTISRSNNPAFGSSSIYLHDLDGDGDEDILYTNGDMMDENPEPKPYHGVRWLENNGSGQYTLHSLAAMPGCYDAKPIDMDGDGDLDIVISALYFQWEDHDFPTLAWLENTGGFKNFIPRKIAYAPTNLANIAVGDFDGNGKPDIIGGGMHVPGPLGRKGRLTMWLQK